MACRNLNDELICGGTARLPTPPTRAMAQSHRSISRLAPPAPRSTSRGIAERMTVAGAPLLAANIRVRRGLRVSSAWILRLSRDRPFDLVVQPHSAPAPRVPPGGGRPRWSWYLGGAGISTIWDHLRDSLLALIIPRGLRM
jgi:hypothetical protein